MASYTAFIDLYVRAGSYYSYNYDSTSVSGSSTTLSYTLPSKPGTKTQTTTNTCYKVVRTYYPKDGDGWYTSSGTKYSPGSSATVYGYGGNKFYWNCSTDVSDSHKAKVTYKDNTTTLGTYTESSWSSGWDGLFTFNDYIPQPKPGYVFVGWSKTKYNPGEGTVTYNTTTSYSIDWEANKSGLTVYAVWAKDEGKVRINVNGTWKEGTPYVNVNGVWKKGKPYINVNGTWKETK